MRSTIIKKRKTCISDLSDVNVNKVLLLNNLETSYRLYLGAKEQYKMYIDDTCSFYDTVDNSNIDKKTIQKFALHNGKLYKAYKLKKYYYRLSTKYANKLSKICDSDELKIMSKLLNDKGLPTLIEKV